MALPRIHAFEFNDHPLAPEVLRESIVEALSRTLDWGKVLDGLIPVIERFVEEAGISEVLDLGAGAGGPARIIARVIDRRATGSPLELILTDLHPRAVAWRELAAEYPERITFIEHAVDATNVPPELAKGRARMAINVFHHFPPAIARGVLEDAAQARSPIFIAEGFERDPRQFLNFLPYGLPSLLLNPILSSNRSVAKTLLTYGAIGIPLGASVWDGFVSTMRVYTERELVEMVAGLPGDYHWVYGNYHYFPRGKGYYFYGIPQ